MLLDLGLEEHQLVLGRLELVAGLLQRVVQHGRVVDCIDEFGAERRHLLAEVGMRVVGVASRVRGLGRGGARVGDGVDAIALLVGVRLRERLGGFGELRGGDGAGDVVLGHG